MLLVLLLLLLALYCMCRQGCMPQVRRDAEAHTQSLVLLTLCTCSSCLCIPICWPATHCSRRASWLLMLLLMLQCAICPTIGTIILPMFWLPKLLQLPPLLLALALTPCVPCCPSLLLSCVWLLRLHGIRRNVRLLPLQHCHQVVGQRLSVRCQLILGAVVRGGVGGNGGEVAGYSLGLAVVPQVQALLGRWRVMREVAGQQP